MKRTPRINPAWFLTAAGILTAGISRAAPNAIVEGVADGVLRARIEQAIGEARSAPSGVSEARRRAVQAAKDAVALLRSEGYYEGAAQPDPSVKVRAAIRVYPGPRFLIVAPSIDWVGAPPDAATRKAVGQALGLPPGGPGRAADIIAAEGRVIARLKRLSYADATLVLRQVVVDHATDTVKATLRVAAGEPVRLGSIRMIGGPRTRVGWLRRLAPWKPGVVYDPALLAKLEKTLSNSGAYETATVALAPASAAASGRRPVDVTLVERKSHTVELGAGYSTTEGSGVDARWTLYNRLGLADSLIVTGKLYDIQQKLDVEQDLPDFGHSDQTLKIGGGFLGDRTAAYDDLGGGVRLAVVRKFDRSTSATVGGAFDFASTREKDAVNLQATPVGQTLDLYITSAMVAVVLDRSNSILNPSRGWRLDAEVDPTWIAGDRNLEYVKAEAQLSGYLPLWRGGPVAAARVKLGSILGGSLPDVPADRRFFAGGGGSVRGYGYQDVGPELSDGTPAGGLSLTEASLELRQPLTGKWGLAAFADVGGVGETVTPQFHDFAVGAGVGVRYDLGFGPLRLDLATPVNPRPGDARVQVYISIGQAF